jgi:predicted MPP superfamily phosphohydrolase
MLLRAVFAVFVLLALLGDARVFLFVLNRFVFGSHRHEKTPWGWMMYTVPPLLLFFSALFPVVGRWLDRPTEGPLLVSIGAAWLIIAAVIGTYWILDRIRILAFGQQALVGIREQPSEVIRLRKAHVPFAFLRNLGAHNDVYDIEVTRHEIFIDDLPQRLDGYRIAFLTDTHVTSFMRRSFYREIVAQVQRFDPHVVLLGGDFVTFRRDIPLIAEVLLTGLTARDGIFAVLGNHDIWAGAEDVMRAMSAHGVRFLINESVTLPLPLVGIDEIYRGNPDVERAFADVDPASFCIGLSHHPDIIDLLGGRRLDLLLCGHTHGGQIRFPFFGAVVVPSIHEAEYAAGFHRVGNVLMYVSRGIGAVPPLRILCRPEVATFVLRRGQRTT